MEGQVVCVVGGAGHVGFPLALTFTALGMRVIIQDVDAAALETIASGEPPFMEVEARELLRKAQEKHLLTLTCNPAAVGEAGIIVLVIGTPVDTFLSPDPTGMTRCLDQMLPYLRDDHLLVLRSTVYPGMTEQVAAHLAQRGKRPAIAFCPERVVQGHAIEEIRCLPQIVSGTTERAEQLAYDLFARITNTVVRLPPIEAELAKLFSNAYRYIQFAITNQFFLIADAAGADYHRLLDAMKHEYPRLAGVPQAGFAAGPCLYKDTAQLAAFYKNQFNLGVSAMLVNESLPSHIVEHVLNKYDIRNMTIGLLGMAFKADSDDSRASLSYKLKKLLTFRAREVLTADPHIRTDSSLKPAEEVVAASDLLILCVPHAAYRGLDTGETTVIDIWDYWRDRRGGTP